MLKLLGLQGIEIVDAISSSGDDSHKLKELLRLVGLLHIRTVVRGLLSENCQVQPHYLDKDNEITCAHSAENRAASAAFSKMCLTRINVCQKKYECSTKQKNPSKQINRTILVSS